MAMLSLLLACDGCKERGSARAPEHSVTSLEKRDGGKEPGELQQTWRDLAAESQLFTLAGRVDVTNRYASAVLVLVNFSEGREGVGSGALIGRHVVLTAGHCVCEQRQTSSGLGTARIRIDAAACVKTAAVETTVYLPGEGGGDDAPARMRRYRGRVQPHPDLQVLLDEQGQVVSSTADLALLFLDQAAEEGIQPLALADSDIQLQETLVIVGSGHDEMAHLYDGKRRYSRNTVTERLASGGGRMRVEQPGGHPYKGDSGGPCLREEPRGLVLVGISSRNLGEGAAITSTYGYRDWLRNEQLARSKPSSPTSAGCQDVVTQDRRTGLRSR